MHSAAVKAPRRVPVRRPFVFVNCAISADGKLAPSSRRFVPFGSPRDRRLLLELRTDADAVMAGARTIDGSPMTLGPGGARWRRLRLEKGRAEYNLRVVVSGSGSVSPRAEIFRGRFSPVIVLTTERISSARLRRLEAVADEVRIFGQSELDFSSALEWLRAAHGVKRLLCEGGGELNDALLRAGLVNELYLTICPLLFGGQGAPTLADGLGASRLADAIPLRLRSMRRIAGELFLVFKVGRNPD